MVLQPAETRCKGTEPGPRPPRIKQQDVIIVLLWLTVELPITLVLVCAVLGLLLSLVEDWYFVDGWLYVLSNALNLGSPLTNTTPTLQASSVILVMYSSVVNLVFVGMIMGRVDSLPAAIALTERIG
mmetsp:Transcript_29581/g.53186  ORF Transcript_29581/g.53186 Transcript_29581/m.53186 type:complete len:127 (-) Transcript_29581:181-561(-)